MGNENAEQTAETIELETEEHTEDIDLETEGELAGDKIKKLREKLKTCEAEKMQALEDLQRAKAEFLNARKRLEEDRQADRLRSKIAHASDLLPLCDSFSMAMSNTEVWEKADEQWRKGVEGIYMQLQSLLREYDVSEIKAEGEAFDPHRFEAVDTVAVGDAKQVDVVQQVLQAGYEIKTGETAQVIRPARVVTGTIDK